MFQKVVEITLTKLAELVSEEGDPTFYGVFEARFAININIAILLTTFIA